MNCNQLLSQWIIRTQHSDILFQQEYEVYVSCRKWFYFIKLLIISYSVITVLVSATPWYNELWKIYALWAISQIPVLSLYLDLCNYSKIGMLNWWVECQISSIIYPFLLTAQDPVSLILYHYKDHMQRKSAFAFNPHNHQYVKSDIQNYTNMVWIVKARQFFIPCLPYSFQIILTRKERPKEKDTSSWDAWQVGGMSLERDKCRDKNKSN